MRREVIPSFSPGERSLDPGRANPRACPSAPVARFRACSTCRGGFLRSCRNRDEKAADGSLELDFLSDAPAPVCLSRALVLSLQSGSACGRQVSARGVTCRAVGATPSFERCMYLVLLALRLTVQARGWIRAAGTLQPLVQPGEGLQVAAGKLPRHLLGWPGTLDGERGTRGKCQRWEGEATES